MQLNPADFIISTFNTGSSWFPNFNSVRIVYMPTQEVEECSSHRGQHANKAEAWNKLVARLTTDNKQTELEFGYEI